MTIQSMDAVLADAEAPVHDEVDVEFTPLSIKNDPPEESDEPEAEGGEPERDAHGALHAERNRVRRKYTDTVADFEKKLSEVNTGFETKLSQTLAERDRQWEQRFNQFAQQLQPRQEPKVEPEVAPDVFENPNGFLEHGLGKAIDPVNQRIARITETFSRRMAIKDHGEEKVTAAFQALDQAARSGNRDAQEMVARVKQSDDPFGDIVDWHGKSSVLTEFGADPEAAIQKRLQAALEDPAFLAKAAEKLGVKITPTQKPANPTLPSLNRVTAAADEDDEEDNPAEVFNTALRSGVRR